MTPPCPRCGRRGLGSTSSGAAARHKCHHGRWCADGCAECAAAPVEAVLDVHGQPVLQRVLWPDQLDLFGRKP